MTTKQKRDWLSLTYIVPWAISGTLFPFFAIDRIVEHMKAVDVLSYAWITDILLLLMVAHLIPSLIGWTDELKDWVNR